MLVLREEVREAIVYSEIRQVAVSEDFKFRVSEV